LGRKSLFFSDIQENGNNKTPFFSLFFQFLPKKGHFPSGLLFGNVLKKVDFALENPSCY
jgi:hypothetical protein